MMRIDAVGSIAALLLALLAATCTAVSAQPYPEPPPPAAARELSIATPFETRLPNGLRVVVAARPGTPLVSAQLLLLHGSELDPPDRAGLAAMMATLLTRGTRSHSAPEIAQAAEALGGTLDAVSGWHASGVAMTVARARLDAALALMVETLTRPAFAGAELERARRQALDGLRVSYANPGRLAAVAAPRLAFGSGPYGHPASGTPASVARMKRSDLVRLHQQISRPQQAVLVLVGDVDPQQATALARQHLTSWRPAPSKRMAQRRPPQPEEQVGKSWVIDLPSAGQAGVVLVLPGIARSAPDYAVGLVADSLLGGGYSSRLNQEIRIKRGLSYGVQSRLDARRAAGMITLAAQTKNESAAEVVRLMHAELTRAIEQPAPAPELEARKATLVGTMSRALETTDSLAQRLAALVINDAPLSELSRVFAAVQGVTASEVQMFARRHWQPADARAVVAGNAAQFVDSLRQELPDLRVIPAQRFDADKPNFSQ